MNRPLTTRARSAKLRLTWARASWCGIAVAALRFVGCSSGSNNAATHTGPVCGNGVVEQGEFCEGLTMTTCAMATTNARPVGNVNCVDCQLDTSGCTAAAGGAPNGGAPSAGAPGTSGGGAIGTGEGGGIVLGSGGTTGAGGATGAGGTVFGAGGTVFGSGGTVFGAGGMTTGAGGTMTAAGGTMTGGGGSAGTDPVLGDVNALRQACVDTINMYRATLMLTPLTRATVTVETCSDTGAKADATAGVAHGSAGKCPGMGAQDTCPGWPPKQYGGTENALKNCLMSMWAEGDPPEGRTKCINDYFAGNIDCFEAHGHYLNMSDTSNSIVSCGFYVMPNGNVWMNQDFGR